MGLILNPQILFLWQFHIHQAWQSACTRVCVYARFAKFKRNNFSWLEASESTSINPDLNPVRTCKLFSQQIHLFYKWRWCNKFVPIWFTVCLFFCFFGGAFLWLYHASMGCTFFFSPQIDFLQLTVSEHVTLLTCWFSDLPCGLYSRFFWLTRLVFYHKLLNGIHSIYGFNEQAIKAEIL